MKTPPGSLMISGCQGWAEEREIQENKKKPASAGFSVP
jgi:hypothetical protein